MPKRLELKNKIFGRLTVINFNGIDKYKRSLWLCRCDCGNEKIILGYSLTSKNTRSCGCLRKDIMRDVCKKINYKHGGRNSITYKSWANMIQRCTNSNRSVYNHYGGRGITICERWLNSFENFLKDMGERPSKKHTLDRIDSNSNYKSENCRWATWETQNRNKKRCKLNEKEVWLIKKLLKEGYEKRKITIKFISKMFCVNEHVIYKINEGKNWKSVKYK